MTQEPDSCTETADVRADQDLADISAWAASAPARALDAIGYLGPQIAADREAGVFDDWACSSVVDENTGEPVLDAAVLEALGGIAGLEVRYPHANAGLVHAYGYLLSPAPTPYGPKRARWTDGALARALGHDPRHFRPWCTSAGDSLLRRVTASALPIALGLTTEHVLHRREDSDGRGGLLVTVVWRAPGSTAAALVYGHVRGGRCRLVTTFPVAATTHWLAELAALPAAPRYNVVVAGC